MHSEKGFLLAGDVQQVGECWFKIPKLCTCPFETKGENSPNSSKYVPSTSTKYYLYNRRSVAKYLELFQIILLWNDPCGCSCWQKLLATKFVGNNSRLFWKNSNYLRIIKCSESFTQNKISIRHIEIWKSEVILFFINYGIQNQVWWIRKLKASKCNFET